MKKNIVLNENGIGVFTAPIHKLTPDDLPPVDKSYKVDEVKYWMELPNIPKEICETYKEYEERNRTYTHIVFSNDGGETISGTSGIQDTDTHFGYIRDNKKELDESLISSDFKWIKFKGKNIQDKYKEFAIFTYLGVDSEEVESFYNIFNNKTEE